MKTRPTVNRITLAAAALLAVAASGCVYTLGTTLPPDLKTINVPTFVNKTQEPQIETYATRAVIQEFQKDGNLKVTDDPKADLHLQVNITAVELEPLRYEKDAPKTTQEYRMWIKGKMTLTRVKTGKVMTVKEVSGDSTFVMAGDMSTSKAAAYPKASEALGRHIVESIVEYW